MTLDGSSALVSRIELFAVSLLGLAFVSCGGLVNNGTERISSAATGGLVSASAGAGMSGVGGKAIGGNVNFGGSAAMAGAGGNTLSATGTAAGGAGGTSPTGGGTAVAAAGSAGAGCTGALEEIQATTGLCVAKLVTVGSGGTTFSIDATEVTRDQYEAWLATNPPLPADTDACCGWKSPGSYAANATCMTGLYACQGTSCHHHPQICVDWCDAYEYCAAVGKRLCGKIGGGEVYLNDYADASLSQWYYACSAGGVNLYTYGNTYEFHGCDGSEYFDVDAGDTIFMTVDVGTVASCQSTVTGYTGVYDLCGNVSEWEDACQFGNVAANLLYCRVRGGSCVESGYGASCVSNDTYERDAYTSLVGFRCCAG